jgi:hypothetical protein
MTTKDKIGYFLTVMLFIASTPIAMLSDHKSLSWTLFIGGIVLSAIVYALLARHRPVEEIQLRLQNDLLRYFLRGVEYDYMCHLDSRGVKRPKIRLNVMIPRVGDPCSCQRILKMEYWEGPYEEWEKKLEWQPGQGKCGQAFSEAKLVWWAQDLIPDDDNTKKQPMPNDRHDKLMALGSVLSTLISSERGDKLLCLGVLSMDSDERNATTFVDDPAVHGLFRDAARQIARLIPEGGIVW